MSVPHLKRLTQRGGDGPAFHLLAARPSDACDLAWSLQAHKAPKVVARTLRGAKARTARALFDEAAAALQFPPYFGENWDALDECLADLEWLPADAYVILVTDADLLLADDTAALGTFVTLVDGLARGWPEADRPASFHVVLQADAEAETDLARRLEDAGARFDRL